MHVARSVLCAALLLAASPVLAQQEPYAGQETREIKALSAEEVEGYRAGSGMGFAKAAELNHYPGPRHVLELAGELGLDPGQKKATQAAYDRMHGETVRLGERLVARERDLDRLFAAGAIDEKSLAATVREIGRLQGEIRLAHLKAHLETRALLTPVQIARYEELRGYAKKNPTAHDPARHGH